MSYRSYVLVTITIILGLSGSVTYLLHDRADTNFNWWNAAIQNQEEALRRIHSLELLLEHGQLDEAVVEVRRHHQRTLMTLNGMIRIRFSAESANRIYALRVYCAEATVDPRLCEASTAISLSR